MKRVLGLDLGPTSIGWSIIDMPTDGEDPAGGRVINAGVRVFPEGVDRDKSGGEVSKNAARRLARAARRQLRRRAMRRTHVRCVLTEAGLWPEDPSLIASVDPYELRARALDQPLSPEELGIAIYQLAKRRGFRSNRRTDEAKESGKVYEGISALQNEMTAAGARTLGEHLHRLRSAAADNVNSARIRGRYTLRTMFEHEFDALWRAQSAHHPALMTQEVRSALHRAIFFQRPLLPTDFLVGYCELEPERRRCPAADRAAQRFRLLQTVNTLRVDDARGDERPLTPDERSAAIDSLSRHEKRTFDQLRRSLGLLETQRFNLERSEKSSVWGHRTDAALRKALKGAADYDSLSEPLKDELVMLLLREENTEAVQSWVMSRLKISAEAAAKLASVTLQKGYMSFSRRAILKLLPHLEAGAQMMKTDGQGREVGALALAGYLRPDQRAVNVLDRLPAPPEDIRNPIVLAALHQLKRVVNAIIQEHGKPDAIHVELAREAKGSIAQRAERTKAIALRTRERDKASEAIREGWGIPQPSRDDIDRFLIWHDFNQTCPYTGETITQAMLFSPEVQVDHILPRSRSLDNSFANRTVCLTRANYDKGDRTPFEWLSGDPARFDAMLQRVRHLGPRGQRGKQRKFAQKTCELDDFLARQLSDTAYIARRLAAYLRQLGADVVCVRGDTTAALRHFWGLNNLLRDDGIDLKSRDDHRHHAVDAAVIALTDRSALQRLARITRTGEVRPRDPVDPPWPTLRADLQGVVNAINVSHRPRRRVSGPLHEETNYGPTDQPGVFAYRKNLESLSLVEVGRIRDGAIRRLVQSRLRSFGIEGESSRSIPKEVWKEPLLMPSGRVVKKVRLTKPDKTIVQLGPSTGRFVKTGANHHVAIFERRDVNGKIVYEPIWVTTLEAQGRAIVSSGLVRSGRPGASIVARHHPEDPNARFICSVSTDDLMLVQWDGVTRLLRYKTGASTQGQMYFVDARDARKDDAQKKFVVNANTLIQKRNARKVTTDLLGRMRWAND